MKTVKLLATGLLLSTVLFNSCKKAGYDTNPANQSANASANASATSREVTGTSLMKLSSGYMNTNYMLIRENAAVFYTSNQPKRTDLFIPLNQAGIAMPTPAHFDNLVMRMETGQMNVPALYLKGAVLLDNDMLVPVELIINGPLTIDVTPGLKAIEGNTTMLELMGIQPEGLGTQITQTMWEKARSANSPVITLSQNQNSDLYNLILKDLNGMIHLTFPNPGPTSSDVSLNDGVSPDRVTQ